MSSKKKMKKLEEAYKKNSEPKEDYIWSEKDMELYPHKLPNHHLTVQQIQAAAEAMIAIDTEMKAELEAQRIKRLQEEQRKIEKYILDAANKPLFPKPEPKQDPLRFFTDIVID